MSISMSSVCRVDEEIMWDSRCEISEKKISLRRDEKFYALRVWYEADKSMIQASIKTCWLENSFFQFCRELVIDILSCDETISQKLIWMLNILVGEFLSGRIGQMCSSVSKV
jgi:hypothetical protein